ncbi:putative ankyrin repeat-containing domain, PGG domain, ankyrin repeat-containing domain superfamily [Helianthus annuus]|nr:putative ankyrin repeat-containing domain, PGG domain, ankyrin repeat-containing domain superfamily [Helianthus annuus]
MLRFSNVILGERGDYIRVVVPLHRALAEGDLKSVEEIFKDHEDLVRYSISANKETPLHVAIMSQSPKLVRYLVDKMGEADLKLQNSDGNTAFCLAAISGNVDMAEIMVKKNPALSLIYATENTMPLCLAAFHGKHKMLTFLFGQSNGMKGYGWTKKHRNEVLLKCIQANMFGTKGFLIKHLYCFAIQILDDNKELPQDEYVRDVLQELAQKPEEFKEITSLIGKQYPSMNIQDRLVTYLLLYIVFKPAEENTAIKLLGLLLKRVTEKLKDFTHETPKTKRDKIKTYLSQILFMAAKQNNKIFLVELIREYPDLIWQRNDDGQTIFHIAVANRNGFHNFYHRQRRYNILHMVGKISEKICYKDSEVTSYEVLWEYFWYEDVKRTLPESSREVKNNNGYTPLEVFTYTHREPVSQSAKWIYDTIGQSMVLAALVCTIGFSIAYSLPGGFDQNTGLPLFRRSKPFIAFIILDSASFLVSGICMLAFLSIVLSRFEKRQEIIIQRWMTAQQALMLSLATLVMAFISSFFLLYPNSILPYIITAIAGVLLAIYIKQHKSFVKVGLYMTFKVWFFHWTTNPRIYYRNPTY